jgi:chorismate synthase
VIRYLTSGESHGKALTAIIEGLPAGISISIDYINHQLKRRQMGFGRGGRMRIESDSVEILAGVRNVKTLGTPITIMIKNRDWDNWKEKMAAYEASTHYEKIRIPRPGHADYVGDVKYQYGDIRNVIERASARETAARVAVCTFVRKFLEDIGIFIGSYVRQIGSVSIGNNAALIKKIFEFTKASCGAYKLTEEADNSKIRMLDKIASKKAISLIRKATKAGDTLGGIFEVIITGVPTGLGSYVHYDRRLDGQLAQAIVSIPAVKGFEIGSGFANAYKFGSKVQDEFTIIDGRIIRTSNNAGGLEGGVTNGQMVILRGAMKPIATLAKPLKSVHLDKMQEVKARYERSDVCAVPAASVIAEAVVAPVIGNAILEKVGGDYLDEINERIKNLKS